MHQRSFTSGSRQAPDPYDQFLEQHGFYRKHTARDASSLFRVISEQMYDTQLHHLAIRKRCVSYMRKHRKYFQMLIDRDLDEYLDDMSKPKTFATLIELQAVGLLYQRNVLLFEPFNLGNYFGHQRKYFIEVFRVFCTPEKHFDCVYTREFIKDAAICQSICYELLYKDLFKVPDVKYAVELMLHSGEFMSQQKCLEKNDDGYFVKIEFSDKRTFDLDLPTETNCILENSELCAFHSSVEKKKDNEKEDGEGQVNGVVGKLPVVKLLPNKLESCVRQLLAEGITPFPYKVAKALDATMYRNIEFDAWNEARKELKLQNWYCGDGNFKIGAKCHVRLPKAENELHICHIQDISADRAHCLVFIEQLGEKRLVPYEALSPLPVEQFKPWALPIRFHRQLQKYNSMRMTRHFSCRFKPNAGHITQSSGTMPNYCKAAIGPASHLHDSFCGSMTKSNASFAMAFTDMKKQQHYLSAASPGQQHHYNSCFYNWTQLENFRARNVEYCTMPLTVEHNVNLKFAPDKNNNTNNTNDNNDDGDLTVAPLDLNAADNSGETNQIVESVVNDESISNTNSTGRELALINQNYSLEQTSLTYMPPEYSTYYPIQSYVGVPEEYYAFGCDAGLNQQYGTCGNAAGMYYMCNPGIPPPPPPPTHGYSSMPANYYLQAPAMPVPPPQSVMISPTAMAPPPQYYPTGTANAFYTTNTNVPHTVLSNSLLNQAASVAHTIHENGNSNTGVSITTPLSGRINYEAKKSVKLNGMDLPSDMATLRYFYNLGIDFHNRRRHSQDSILSSRENVNVREERSDLKDQNGNKADANNNISANVNSKSSPSTNNANSSHQNSATKPAYGGMRRFNNRYNNNRDRQQQQQQQPQQQRRNSVNNDEVASQRNYNDYSKNNNKHQHHQGINERHADMNRPNSTPNVLSHNAGHRQQQHIRVNGRNSFYENYAQNSSMSGAGDGGRDSANGVKDNTVGGGGEHGDNVQPYSSYGQQPPSNYEFINDYNTTTQPPNAANGPAPPGNGIFIPVQVQQTAAPYSAMFTTSGSAILQPMTTAAPPPNFMPPHFFGPPPPSPLIHNGYGPPPQNGAMGNANCVHGGGGGGGAGFYTASSNPISSNTSESSGAGGGGGNGNNDNVSNGMPTMPPAIIPHNYGTAMPVHFAPNAAASPASGSVNGQTLLHHSLQPPPPPPASHLHGSGPQGYWCVPPPPMGTGPPLIPPPSAQVQPNVGYMGPAMSVNNAGQTASPGGLTTQSNNVAASQKRRPSQQSQNQQQHSLQQQQQQQSSQQNDKESSH